MTFHFNLINSTKATDISVTHLRGLIGEEIAAYLLRKKLNLCVVRPSRLISSLEVVNLKTAHYEFLVKHQKTMDFIGIWPSVVDFTGERFRTAALDLFTSNSLIKSLIAEKNYTMKGYVIEVKSTAHDIHSRPQISLRQMKMVKLAKKVGFETILVQVTFLPNYETRVRFFNGNGDPVDIAQFDSPDENSKNK
ncbi:MAG: hypothetical protein ACXACI_11440 [Candidatus Hodarchaeales archaeon]|jgi:hypothetical protein